MKPSSLEEAVEAIQKEFSSEKLKEWAAQPEDEACSRAHFGIGMWIRNEWVYGDGDCPLVAEIRKRKQFILHDDEISGIIIRALWRVLNGQSCPAIEDLLEHNALRAV